MTEDKAVKVNRPAEGSVIWYAKFLAYLEDHRVPDVNETLLQNLGITKSNERKFVLGLKSLGLIDKDRKTTDAAKSLGLKGKTRRENFDKFVRNAYSTLFQEAKIDLKTAEAVDLIDFFKIEYEMGSGIAAGRAARVFVFLARKAEIGLSDSIDKNLSVSFPRGEGISRSRIKMVSRDSGSVTDSYQKYLDIKVLPSDFYHELQEEINKSFTTGVLPAVQILCRKFLENLIIDILRKKYGMSNVELFYDTDRGRFHGFEVLLKHLDEKIDDFVAVSPALNRRFLKRIDWFREQGNSSAHTIELNLKPTDLENDAKEIEHIIEVLARVFDNL